MNTISNTSRTSIIGVTFGSADRLESGVTSIPRLGFRHGTTGGLGARGDGVMGAFDIEYRLMNALRTWTTAA